MAIIYAPAYTVNSIYSPCTFVTSWTNAIPVVKAQAEIYVDGAFIVSNIEKSPYSNVGTTYYFEFDISRILQTLNQPKPQNQTSIFGEYGQPYIATNNDIHCFFYAIIKYHFLLSV